MDAQMVPPGAIGGGLNSPIYGPGGPGTDRSGRPLPNLRTQLPLRGGMGKPMPPRGWTPPGQPGRPGLGRFRGAGGFYGRGRGAFPGRGGRGRPLTPPRGMLGRIGTAGGVNPLLRTAGAASQRYGQALNRLGGAGSAGGGFGRFAGGGKIRKKSNA